MLTVIEKKKKAVAIERGHPPGELWQKVRLEANWSDHLCLPGLAAAVPFRGVFLLAVPGTHYL